MSKLTHYHSITHVVHLAAQAGVRHSVSDPGVFIRDNIRCFSVLLETLSAHPAIKLVYASSSSVYADEDAAGGKPFNDR